MSRFILFLLSCLVFSGCSRTQDTFQPRIVITSPQGNSTDSLDNLTIKGYVLDDVQVNKLIIDDVDIDFDYGSQKIKYFTYKPSKKDKQNNFLLKAFDEVGNQSSLNLNIIIDNQLPTIQISNFERFGKQVRVSGIVSDNNKVAQILVDGERINISPAAKVTFFAEVEGTWADITAVDDAGNEFTKRVR